MKSTAAFFVKLNKACYQFSDSIILISAIA